MKGSLTINKKIMNASALQKLLWEFLERNIPRILSQLDRDYHSPTYGSFDRDFWHYKIRYFSSIILQQGMIILQVLKNFKYSDNVFYKNDSLDAWIDGGLRFWASSQLNTGSFNEYYPNEHGFPPTAFSLYAVGLILQARRYETSLELKPAIQKAINWLLAHPEKKALNQEMAGLAGIALCSRIKGITIDKNIYDKRLKEFFDSQSPEGWFSEYDGPDIGYLSVTIDCLYDYYLVSVDLRALQAIEKAVDFIYGLITISDELPVMINSRNTGYLVPYGITRFAEKNKKAATIIFRLFSNVNHPRHFLNKTDDRYVCHYIFQSCFRSLEYLNLIDDKVNLNKKSTAIFYKNAGIYCSQKNNLNIIVNARKGGVIYVYKKDGLYDCDFGWRIMNKKSCAVTHWQDQSYTYAYRNNSISIEGVMSNHAWIVPSAIKHIGLRIMSIFWGNKLIPFLKNIMIFNRKSSGVVFIRTITCMCDHLTIHDEFKGSDNFIRKLEPAPHHSLRHVASAGSFEFEELMIEKNKKLWSRDKVGIFNRVIKF